MTDGASPTCSCKVGRSAEAYGLDGLDADLRRRYGDADESLRALSEFVNVSIVGSALDRTESAVVGDAESIYRALVGSDVSPERRADVRDQLTYAGVDVERVLGDFVSHQTVKTHLNECLAVDTSRRGVESLDDGRRVIEWARERDEHIIEQTVSQLRRAGVLRSGPLDVTHTVTVRCQRCGETAHLNRLLDDRGCACGGEG